VTRIGPARRLALSYSRIFQVRYFVIAFPFFLLLSARLACLGWDRSGNGGRAMLLLALATFLAGNFQRDYFLLTQGRGRYSQALAEILRNSPPGPVLVGSDHDFRNGLVLQFHASRIPGGDRLRYVDQVHARHQKPDWFLVHSQDIGFLPPTQIQIGGLGVYQLAGRYGYAGLSGWNWFVYRRIG